ncbi:RrF2 family transcriptional regulator [Luteibaculum oceani]|uniref:Rrf2 family transcriptional regulator n=1 Tax=Luteibaculum oceani TaxID=1294296 RepID=A0A5C6UYZ8_9FLAO|nr:Rrf2 family transcriptional regulator [Luteibaculum oceani]TXC78642.1 Rrf2 family transcriptional regulator [Luteibaculum oceani]
MLSKKTKYAFQALIYLNKNRDQSPILISTIASSTNISKKFLENILLDLKKAGILGSKMGKGGGYFLMKDPENIPMASVIRLFSGPIALVPCVSINYYERCSDCADEETCKLHDVMLDVRDQSLRILEGKTLADLC